MEKPASVDICFTHWTIAWGEEAVAALLTDGDEAGGACQVTELAIAVDTSPALIIEQVTLLHELLHACIAVAGTPIEDEEELVVATLAGPLLDLLRRNPKAMAYLLA